MPVAWAELCAARLAADECKTDRQCMPGLESRTKCSEVLGSESEGTVAPWDDDPFTNCSFYIIV
jgi:hypothetical protein